MHEYSSLAKIIQGAKIQSPLQESNSLATAKRPTKSQGSKAKSEGPIGTLAGINSPMLSGQLR
jgi:hypothetical protein